jgi:hypothetical protein
MPSNTLNPYCTPALRNGTTPSLAGFNESSIQMYFAAAMVSSELHGDLSRVPAAEDGGNSLVT